MKTSQIAFLVSSILFIGTAVPVARGEDPVPDEPCGDSGETLFMSSEEGTGPKYRKIGFNGFPIPDEKPQATPETDAEEEESFVDAFNHTLSYQVTDVYVPFQGTDLTLSVRRNWTPEIWNLASGANPARRPDRPFGAGWASSLSAGVRFESGEVPYAYVTDTNGVTYRFLVLSGIDIPNVHFLPMPENRHQREVMATKLEMATKVVGGVRQTTYKFTSKMGTVLEFEDNGAQMLSGGVGIVWARLKKATDRFGTELVYEYTAGTPIPYQPKTKDISPARITCREKTIGITYTADGRVDEITDPRGKTHKYHYAALQSALEGSLTPPGLVSVERPDSTDARPDCVSYSYSFINEADTMPRTADDPANGNRYFYVDLGTITDPNMATTTITYALDHSRKTYMISPTLGNRWYSPSGSPCNVTSISLPDGTGATFSNLSDVSLVLPSSGGAPQVSGKHQMVVTDAKGGTWTYDFSDGLVVTLDFWKDLIGFDSYPFTPKMILWQTMVVSTPEGGTMEATFDKWAGMALKSFKDVGVTTATQFEYGDQFTYTLMQPWMKGLPIEKAIAQLPTTMWGDVTKQTDGRGKVKTFKYEESTIPAVPWRVMKKITDEERRVTEYTIDPANGNRKDETVKSAAGEVVKTTDFEYSSASGLAGILTKKTIRGGATAPGATTPVDLVTIYTLEPGTTGNIWKEQVGGLSPTVHTYDDNNNKLTTTDPDGNTTTFVYDDLNRLTEVDFPGGANKLITYDLRGNKIAEKDENGHWTAREYDALGRVTKEARHMNSTDVTIENNRAVIEDSDLVTATTYDGLGAKTSVTSPNLKTTDMEYDGLNRLVKLTNPPVIDPATGNPVRYETNYIYGDNSGGLQFGRNFQPTTVVDARNFHTITVYDASFRPTSRKVEYKQDAQGQPVFAETKFEYDDVGNLMKETDPLIRDTLHAYDALNRETVTTWPDLHTTQTFYTPAGLKWKTVDELGHDTLTEYDAAGRPVKVKSPEVDSPEIDPATQLPIKKRAVTQMFYDDAGNVVKTINPRGYELAVENNPYAWVFEYDNRNRKTKEWRPGNARPIVWAYDAAGNVVKTTDARGNDTDTTYDVANRVTKVEEPSVPISGGGSARPTTQKGYDKNGNVTSLTDPNGHATSNSYDPLNRLLATTDAEGIVVSNEYDEVGNRTAVIDGKSQRTEFAYDGLNRLTLVTDALGKSTAFEFDAVNKTARVDAIGQRTEYGYDQRNRLLAVIYVGRTQDNRALAYDTTGNLLAVVEATPSKSVAYTYDALKRQLTETSGGLTHIYRYDLAGNRTYCLYGGLSVPLLSTYDEQNRLATLAEGGLVTAYAYDANGNVLAKTLPNGDTATSVFDAANRTTSLAGTSGTNASLYAYAYEYDAAGNVKKITETCANTPLNRIVENDYDAINRLTAETEKWPQTGGPWSQKTTFNYDAAHNRTRRAISEVYWTCPDGIGGETDYTYNENNQLTGYTGYWQEWATSPVAYTYDDNGNRLTRTEGEGEATDWFSWDYENRLLGLTKQSAGGVGTYGWAYDYRTRRVNLTTPSAALTTVSFSGGTSVREIANGVPTVDYVRGSDWGGGVGGILYTLRGGVPSFTHYDRRGDVTAKTDATGTITYQASYEAFGMRIGQIGSTPDRQKSNTKDEDIPGYANEGFRFRDLETGAFLSKDPLGFVDGPNLYAYVVDNPWTHFDPEGLESDLGSDKKFHPEATLYRVKADPNHPNSPIITPVNSAKDIKRQNATIFINGMDNPLKGAAALGLQHTGKSNFYMIHNPSDGGFNDFVKECIPERLGAHLAVDRSTRDILKKFDLANASIYAHSQGTMIMNHALEDLSHEGVKTQGMKLYYDGSAANINATRNISKAAGATIERFDGHPLDAVHNIVGMNSINPARIAGSLVSTPLLFQKPDWSPHGYQGGGSHLQAFNDTPVFH